MSTASEYFHPVTSYKNTALLGDSYFILTKINLKRFRPRRFKKYLLNTTFRQKRIPLGICLPTYNNTVTPLLTYPYLIPFGIPERPCEYCV